MSRTHRWLAALVACWLLPAPFHSADDPTLSGASWWRANQSEGKAVDMSIAWTGDLKIKNKDGRMVVITSTPHDGGNADLHSISAGYGVHKLLTDPPHWSVDGR